MTDKSDIIIRRNGHNIRFPAPHAVSEEVKKRLILGLARVLKGKKREERDGGRDN